MADDAQLDFSKAQPLTLDFSKAQPIKQGEPLKPPTGPTGLKAVTLADRVKRAIDAGKESLPYASAGAAAAMAPATGGVSEVLLPLLYAAFGGAGGTALKHAVAAGIGSGDRPKSLTDALQQDVTGGLEQAGYEAGGRMFGSAIDHIIRGPLKAGQTSAGALASKAVRNRVANLTAMTDSGVGEETGANYNKVLGDIDQTIAQVGGRRPQTPAGVYNVIRATGQRLDQSFNQELAKVGHDRVVPLDISDRIKQLISPSMVQTPAGRAERKEILAAAVQYEKPWNYNQLNDRRMLLNNKLDPFYNKDSQAQLAALSDVQKKIMKAERDGAADMVYDAVDKKNPSFGARDIKAKQGALLNLKSELDKRVDTIAEAQLGEEGKTLRQKVTPSAVVTSRGAHGYLRGLSKLVPGGGPERQALTQTEKAFDPRRFSTRARILRTPWTNLARGAGAAVSVGTQGDDEDDNEQ